MGKNQQGQDIRNISRETPATEEVHDLIDELTKYNASPIVSAILGLSLLEHDLEALLRPKFRTNDNTAWARLTGDNGPLSTFSQKVLMAEAFDIIDEPMRKNLNAIAAIRNAFAHSKKLINFDLPVIRKKLRSIYFPLHKKKLRKKLKESFDPPFSRQATFIFICLIISTEIQKGRVKVLKRSVQAKAKRMNKNPYFRALLSMSPIQLAFALPLLPASQSGDPTTQVPAQGIADILERWSSQQDEDPQK